MYAHSIPSTHEHQVALTNCNNKIAWEKIKNLWSERFASMASSWAFQKAVLWIQRWNIVSIKHLLYWQYEILNGISEIFFISFYALPPDSLLSFYWTAIDDKRSQMQLIDLAKCLARGDCVFFVLIEFRFFSPLSRQYVPLFGNCS